MINLNYAEQHMLNNLKRSGQINGKILSRNVVTGEVTDVTFKSLVRMFLSLINENLDY